MCDLNGEFEQLCKAHGIDCETGKNNYNLFLDTFESIWDDIPADAPTAFFGCGEGFVHMYNRIKSKTKNLVCVIENYLPTTFNDIPVFHMSEAKNLCLSKVILTGFRSRVEMAAEIQSTFNDVEIIDVFDVLKRKGTPLHTHFLPRKGLMTYKSIYEQQYEYSIANTPDEIRTALTSLIYTYLENRDIYNSLKHIDEYINREYPDAEKMLIFKNALIRFIDNLKELLSQRTNHSVVVMVIDSLTYDATQNHEYFRTISNESKVFTNAYSPCLHTKSSTFCYVTGKYYVRDNLFKCVNVSIDDSTFIQELRCDKTKFKHIGNSYFTFLSELNDYNIANQSGDTQPLLLWNFISDLLSEENNTVYFIHTQEYHMPSFSTDPRKESVGYFTACKELYENKKPDKSIDFIANEERIRADALDYICEQIVFYTDLLCKDNTSLIITSDHHRDTLSFRLSGKRSPLAQTRIPLYIQSKYVTPGLYTNLYSTIDISNILLSLSRKTSPTIPYFDYVRREIEPSYGKQLMISLEKSNTYGKIELFNDNELYIFYLNGNDEYYTPPDNPTNMIDNELYADRVKYFREIIGDMDTKDIWKFMFNKYPYLTELHKDELLSLAGD